MSDHHKHSDSNHNDSNDSHGSHDGEDNNQVAVVAATDTSNADVNHIDTASTDVAPIDATSNDVKHVDTASNDVNHVDGTQSQNTTTASANAGATLGSDGFEHQATDATHHDVQGAQTIQNAIQGSNGNDLITGGNQGDVLSGGNGSDVISGGAGNDILVAGGQKTSYFNDFFAANATLNTAIHADAKFSDIASIVGGTLSGSNSKVENDFQIHGANGNDIILNFHAATDKIVLDHGLNGSDIQDSASLFNHLSVHGNNVSIDLGLGNSITLVGVDASSLSASDFIIV